MSIVELLQEHGIDFIPSGQHRHVRPGWIGIRCCPFCGSQNYHLGINIERAFTSCWRCGSHRLWETLKELGIPISEIKGITFATPSLKPKTKYKLQVPASVGPLEKAHRDYLRSRGFNASEIEQLWGIKGIGLAYELRWRIWIPVHHHGEVVSWTTRTIGDQQPRYISASPEEEALSIKSILYGSDLARHACIVTEGPLDTWAIGPGGVALCGLQATGAQLLAIAEFPVRVLLLDSEPAAQKRARLLADRLEPLPGRTIVAVLDTGKDAASADRREIRKLRMQFLGD